MAFLCPVRLKKKKEHSKPAIPVGRITGSASLDTLTQVQTAKETGTKVHMVIVQDFEPCVSDEIRVRRGEHVKVLYQENDWLYIQTADGREGFVPYNYCLPLERSVDDFIKLDGDNDNRQLRSMEITANTKPCSSKKVESVQLKSVPDIAWNCEVANRGSRLQGSRLTRSLRSDSGPMMGHTRNGMPGQGVRHSFSVRQQDKEFQANSRALSKNNFTSSVSKNGAKSSLIPRSSDPGKLTGGTSNGNIFNRDVGDDHKTQHIYVNDNFAGNRWINGRNCKPDILPVSTESATGSRNRTTSESGSKWRNSSTRSAPETWSANSYHRTTSERLKQDCTSSTNMHHAREVSYTTAQVTCDLFRSNSQTNISVFTKANKGNFLVLYDFEKQDEGDLTVRKGEFVTVLNTDDPDWFWVLNRWNEEGFVPSTYLQLSSNFSDSRKQISTAGISHTRSASLPVTSQNGAHKDIHHLDLSHSIRLVCLYSYVAETEQHLSISRGDWLYADYDSQLNEDWLWVYSPKQQKSGYVPRSYVKAPNFGYQGESSRYDANVADVQATPQAEHSKCRDLFTSP